MFISTPFTDGAEDDSDSNMDCSVTTTATTPASEATTGHDNSHRHDDHLLPSNESSVVPTARIISVCEIQPSFYLTAPIRRSYDPTNNLSASSSSSSLCNDQSTPHSNMPSVEYQTNCSTPSSTDFHRLQYSHNDEETNKENNHYLSTLTPLTSSSDLPTTTEVKKSTIYKLILRNPLRK